jgi:hypothetical protein
VSAQNLFTMLEVAEPPKFVTAEQWIVPLRSVTRLGHVPAFLLPAILPRFASRAL